MVRKRRNSPFSPPPDTGRERGKQQKGSKDKNGETGKILFFLGKDLVSGSVRCIFICFMKFFIRHQQNAKTLFLKDEEMARKTVKSNDELRIGVIGAGGRGRLAYSAHKPGNGSRVVALCDIRDEAFKEWQEFVGAKEKLFLTDDYRKLLDRKDVDAVFVTAPDYLHEEFALAALEAGKAVYLEKPMTITVEGCDKVLETAKKTGSKLFVGHNMRHMDFIIKMKELIEAGTIGNLQTVWCRHFINYGGDAYFKDWHSEQKYTTGLLLQKGAHDIDVIHWLSGGFTKRVVGMGRLSVYNRCKNRRKASERGNASWSQYNWPPLSQKGISPVIDVEDESTLMMQLDNGVLANYMQCHYAPDACRNYTFIGDAGRIENIDERRIAIYTTRCGFGDPDTIIRMPPTVGGHGGADPDIVASFVTFAKGEGSIPSNSPIAARNSVAAGVLGSYSIRNGNVPMDVPPPDPDLVKYFNNGQKKASLRKSSKK